MSVDMFLSASALQGIMGESPRPASGTSCGQLAYQVPRTRLAQTSKKYTKLTTQGTSACYSPGTAGGDWIDTEFKKLDKQEEAINQYGVPSQEVFEKQAKATLDSWFALIGFFAVIAVIIRAPFGQGRMPWVCQQLHKLSIAGSVGMVLIMATGAQCCKHRLLRCWHKQHSNSRVQKVDMIPPMCHAVAILHQDTGTMKQDLSDIKQDLSDIKGMLRS